MTGVVRPQPRDLAGRGTAPAICRSEALGLDGWAEGASKQETMSRDQRLIRYTRQGSSPERDETLTSGSVERSGIEPGAA